MPIPGVNTFARPLRRIDPEAADLDDLETVRDLVGDARVVALGEGAHNITEFYGLKDRLFRILVRELGFTGFVMESGFAEGLAVNEWIHGGAGQVEAVARDGITYRFGECEPMRRQLRWMRRWNSESPTKVNFYGMDLPGSSTSPGPAVRACLARMPRLPGDEELLRLSDLGGRTEAAVRYGAMPVADRARLLEGLRELGERALLFGDEVVRRCAASLHAFVEELDAPPAGPYPREAFMAETVSWILEREQRVVVSAHNAHVRRSPFLDRPTMGGLLAPSLGADLVVVGMTYGSGPEVRFTQRSPRPFDCDVSLGTRTLPSNCIESRLDRIGPPAAVVDLHRAPSELLDGVAGTLANGGLDPVEDFPAAYDALVHLRQVTRVPGAFERLRAEFEAAAGPDVKQSAQLEEPESP
ncbi:erythromycin esterase family protein [Streptosporangium carneum]|uniref:Erythromycin esterase n=1 Tax=Streptosporangium carneum TaxID=47481 RepID=A0A9W6I5L5_9ACTN|nr:erythromycin esterase family protein [Streptosporangium carneum]GLK12527.1 erythromycin esterase [Streptosporangium carneum]